MPLNKETQINKYDNDEDHVIDDDNDHVEGERKKLTYEKKSP